MDDNAEQLLYWVKLWQGLLGSLVFGGTGIILAVLGFKVFDWITPRMDIQRELAEKQNIAVAIVWTTALGELNHLLQRHHRVLGGSSERSIRLSAVAPDAATDPFPRDTFAHCINSARTIAVRNDTRIWHSNSERILTLFHIARIHA